MYFDRFNLYILMILCKNKVYMIFCQSKGKTNVFHLNYHLPMFYMYCILEFERGYHIPQAYLPKWTEKRFCTEILV